jgi:hypothetical protein
MTKVIFDISMSLDGVITAANRRPEEPMGDGGERLHEWAFEGGERDREVMEAGLASIGGGDHGPPKLRGLVAVVG